LPGNIAHCARLGADRAILVETEVELQPLAVAKLLRAIVQKKARSSSSRQAGIRRRLQPNGANARGAARAGHRTFLRKVKISDGRQGDAEVDGGLETSRSRCPPW